MCTALHTCCLRIPQLTMRASSSSSRVASASSKFQYVNSSSITWINMRASEWPASLGDMCFPKCELCCNLLMSCHSILGVNHAPPASPASCWCP